MPEAPDQQLEGDLYLLVGLITLVIRIFVVLLGLVGNTFSLIVWSRPQLKSPTSVVLVSLAVSDTLVILCGLWIDLPKAYGFLKQYKGNLIWDHKDFIYMLDNYTAWVVYHTATTASMYLTLILTMDRYLCIFHPFRFSEWCSYSRTCKFVRSAVIFSIVSDMGKLIWELKAKGYFSGNLDGREVTSYKEVENVLYQNERMVFVWKVVVVRDVLPLTCIVTLNTMTYIKLIRVNKERLTMTDAQKNENKLTRMIIYVVAEYLVYTSYTAFASMSIIFPSIWPSFSNYGQVFLSFQVRELLNSLNSSVNFVTYFSSFPPFRKTFVTMFCCNKELVRTSPPPRPGIDQTSV